MTRADSATRGRRLCPLLAWVLLLLCGGARAGEDHAPAGIRVADDAGGWVVLGGPARRIVSLAPHLTELLFELGAQDRLVGAVSGSDFPPAAREIPRVGDAARIDLERTVASNPDLVLAWRSGNSPADLEGLERTGIAVFRSEPRTLEDLGRTLERLGTLTGREAEAGALERELERRSTALRQRFAGRRAVTVFYQVWDEPLITLNGEHIVSEVLRLCGGQNVFSDLGPLAPQVTREAVLAADPEVIIAAIESPAQDPLQAWGRWPGLRAARLGNLYTVPADSLHRPTLRLLEGAERICAILAEARAKDSRSAPKPGGPLAPRG